MAQTCPNQGLVRMVIVAVAVAGTVSPVGGQGLPTEPISMSDGRVVVSSEISLSYAAEDNAWFNYTNYEQSALRHARLDASAAFALARRVQLLTEVRSETGRPFEIYAMFVRVRPWLERAIDLQAGRIPPTFGAYGRRSYGVANPLIGMPLPYQYLISLRPDALPATADDLLDMRGRGWRPSFPVGSHAVRPGVPMISALSWDTGLQIRFGDRRAQLVTAITNGTLANPRVRDDNRGKQIAARAMFQPSVGLDIGVSAARGDFVDREARSALGDAGDDSFDQFAIGADVEYSRGHWVIRTEGIVSSWSLPRVASPALSSPLRAWGLTTEGRYALRPGLFLAGRVGHLGFSSIIGTRYEGRPTPWEAPTTRIEVGGGYSLTRNVIAKMAYQHNWRDGGSRGRSRFLAGQLLYWF